MSANSWREIAENITTVVIIFCTKNWKNWRGKEMTTPKSGGPGGKKVLAFKKIKNKILNMKHRDTTGW